MTPLFLSQEPHEQYETAKIYDIRKGAPLGQQVSKKLLGKSRQMAPEKMKRLGQSGNDAQLWMCLVVKVKYDAIKCNIAQKHGMLGPLNQHKLDEVKQEMSVMWTPTFQESVNYNG